jgi:acetyl esterase/lipase
MNPPPWKSANELEKVAPLIHPTPAQKAQLKYEWDAPFGLEDRTDAGEGNPLRIPLWASLMTEGLFLDFLTGVEGLGDKVRAASEAKGELDTSVIPTQVRHLIPQLNLDASFPPTHLTHGTADSSVRFSESVKTHEQLKDLGVPVELALAPDEEHMFEWGREDVPAVRKIIDSIVLFVCKHLEA